MTDTMIAKLEAKGGKRWIKGNMDRMYFNATVLGLELEYYKTGNIRDASFRGTGLSNSMGGRYKAAKTYIDLATGDVHSDFDCLADAVRELIAQAEEEIKAEIAAEEETTETETAAMSAEGIDCQTAVLKTLDDTQADFSPKDRTHPRFAEINARLERIRAAVSACKSGADLLACFGTIHSEDTRTTRIRALGKIINTCKPANDEQRALLGL